MSINEDKLYKLIGQRIKEKRLALNLNQEHLAQEIAQVRTSITNIESGRQKTPLHLLYRLCTVLEMDDIKDLLPDLADVLEPGVPTKASFPVSRDDLTEHPKAAQVFQKLKDSVGEQT